MFCEKCGKEIADNAQFCRYCGASVRKKEMGTDNRPQIRKTQKKETQTAVPSHKVVAWIPSICGIVVFLSIFLPFIDYEYLSLSGKDLMALATGFESDWTGIADSGALPVVIMIIAVTILLLALALLVRISRQAAGGVGIGGAILLLLTRLLPNVIISQELSEWTGSYTSVNLIKFGAGWWLMFLAFAAAAVAGLIVPSVIMKR